MVACALPLRVGSARLVAVSVTGFGVGIVAGAKYSTLPEIGPRGAQGFDAGTQIWPTVEFPSAIPFTVQVTAVLDEFATVAVNMAR